MMPLPGKPRRMAIYMHIMLKIPVFIGFLAR